jgi:hypothetical protein
MPIPIMMKLMFSRYNRSADSDEVYRDDLPSAEMCIIQTLRKELDILVDAARGASDSRRRVERQPGTMPTDMPALGKVDLIEKPIIQPVPPEVLVMIARFDEELREAHEDNRSYFRRETVTETIMEWMSIITAFDDIAAIDLLLVSG